MRIAITRDVGPEIAGCQLSFVTRSPIDVALAQRQHAAYCDALRALGCEVIALPAPAGLPDAVFVEDVALVLDEVAVMTRPGAESRRAEVDSVAAVLAGYRPLRAIDAPGTLDGGDVLRIGRRLFVGQAARSNADGVARLRDAVSGHGYEVRAVPTRQCLHLKSAATLVADDTVLVNPRWVDAAVFDGLRIVEVDPGEEHAANALRIGAGVIHPACFPRTQRRLKDAGIAVTAVDVSELQKAEGAVTCCSLVFPSAVRA